MSEMLERAARAARAYMESVNPDEHTGDELTLGVARAVLMAVRGLPEEEAVVFVGRDAADASGFDGSRKYGAAFTAMIDAILNGGDQ
ncbi:hypothetical protein [Brevundimonas sp.]|uniref:hypothetical protein n=1 Tax=Brevundimonas sp. TaxID=1871086 RepID=UPI0035B0B7CD